MYYYIHLVAKGLPILYLSINQFEDCDFTLWFQWKTTEVREEKRTSSE